MSASLRALLSSTIDYAGMFPPASLGLDEAIRKYAHYRQEPAAWLLARFVCPVSKLESLASYREFFRNEPPVALSVLLRGADDRDGFFAAMREDVALLDRFLKRHSGWVRVESFEVRYPPKVAADVAESVFDGVRALFDEAGVTLPLEVYELTFGEDWKATLPILTSRIGAYHRKLADAGPPAAVRGPAVKLRTGGVSPEAFPSSDRVGRVIRACRDAEVPLKLTAGLHHPLRHVDPALQCFVHGFVNVFAAATLAYALALDLPDIIAILDEQDARQFRFGEEYFGWNEAEATLSEIDYARKHRVLSFGSCSFDEPRDDLARFGWI